MNFGIIRSGGEEQSKKKLNKIVIFLIIGAIAFLAFGSFRGDKDPQKEENEESFDLAGYKKSLEEETEAALSQIKGAGEVKVILSFDSMGKTVVARNSQSKTQKDTGGSEGKESKETSDSIVLCGQGQSEKPYVTEEKMPLPSGILVIAKGAGNETVRYELYEAVKALYGISSHRIKVTVSKK